MYLVIDTPNLCYRAMYTTGGLSHEGQATGVVFGVLRDVQHLTRKFATDKVIFCFDHGKGLREQLVSTYKQARRDKEKTLDPEKAKAKRQMREQIQLLKTEYLAELGFQNVWYRDGYEADDLIATWTRFAMEDDEKAVIVSGDRDLFQLLRRNVTQYDPIQKKLFTHTWFEETYDIGPRDWRMVKAIAGCVSDSVDGVDGVGEKTAIKYMQGKLARHTSSYKKIVAAEDQIKLNLKLVRLPFLPGPEPFPFEDHGLPSPEQWNALTARLGMHSLEQKSDKRPAGFGVREETIHGPRSQKRQ